jgi:hypothetical protein
MLRERMFDQSEFVAKSIKYFTVVGRVVDEKEGGSKDKMCLINL